MTRTLAALAVLLIGSAFAQADVILDDFTNPTPGAQFVIANSNGNPYSITTVLPGGPPSPFRSAVFTVTSPTPAGPFSLLGVIGGGSLDMFLDSTSSGKAVLTYVFSAPMDFTTISGPAGAIRLTTQSQATIGNPDVAFTLSLQTQSGIPFSTSGSFANSSGFIDQDVPLSGFTGDPRGDLTKVTGLTLTVTGQTADDFRLDKIALTEPHQTPAPAGVLLAFAALPVLGLRRYLGRKA